MRKASAGGNWEFIGTVFCTAAVRYMTKAMVPLTNDAPDEALLSIVPLADFVLGLRNCLEK